MAVAFFKWLAPGQSPQRPRFNPEPFYIRFMVNMAALGRGSFHVYLHAQYNPVIMKSV